MSDTCYMGDDFKIHFPKAADVTGAAVSLAGATLYCSVKTGTATAVAASSTAVDEAAGTCTATFGPAKTAAFTANALYQYDGVVLLGNGEYHTVGTGSFKAVSRVTSNPS